MGMSCGDEFVTRVTARFPNAHTPRSGCIRASAGQRRAPFIARPSCRRAGFRTTYRQRRRAAASIRARTSSKWKSSDHVQRTTSYPCARIASSRSFSRRTVSALAPGSADRYLPMPSNSSTTPNSSRKKSVRATNAPPAVRISNCRTGSGRPAARMRGRLIDSPGLSLRPSRNAHIRRAAAIPVRVSAAVKAAGSAAWAAGRSLSAESPSTTARSASRQRAVSTIVRAAEVTRIPSTISTSLGAKGVACTCSWEVRRPPEGRFRLTWTSVRSGRHRANPCTTAAEVCSSRPRGRAWRRPRVRAPGAGRRRRGRLRSPWAGGRLRRDARGRRCAVLGGSRPR